MIPPAPYDFLLSIAGITGHLSFEIPSSLAAELRARYEDFLVPPAPWARRDFSLRLASDGKHSTPSNGTLPHVEADDEAIVIRRWDFDARLQSTATRGGPRWTGKGKVQGNVYSIDTLLRVLWTVFLRREGGALFHACGLKKGDDGILFPGVSGAGKTTLARKARSVEDVLSDELVPARRGGDGTWRIYASPFWGEFGKGRGSLSACRLAGAGFLEKADRLSVEPIAPGEAAQRLLETMLCFEQDRHAVDQNVELSIRLASEVPSFRASTSLVTPAEAVIQNVLSFRRKSLPPVARTKREVISELRSLLRDGKPHAIVSTGASMRPRIRSGDTLFIKAPGETPPSIGDVLVTWIPGETEKEDALICHRMISGASTGRTARILTKGDALSSIERVRDGRESEILGTVVGMSRDGKARALGGRLGKLTAVVSSLAAAPILKVREALR